MDDYEIKKNVGLRIKNLRKKNKDTQQDLANAIHLSKDSIAKIESGKMGLTLPNMLAIAERYQVSCDYIARGKNKKLPLDIIEEYISIKYNLHTIGIQNFKYPVLQIKKALLQYLIRYEQIEYEYDISEEFKIKLIKESQRTFYDNIHKENFKHNTELALVRQELIDPDENKSNWKQSDFIGEISRQDLLL